MAGKGESNNRNEPLSGSVVDEESESTGNYHGTESMRNVQEDFFAKNLVTGGGVLRNHRQSSISGLPLGRTRSSQFG
jgi:hypothetical protein